MLPLLFILVKSKSDSGYLLILMTNLKNVGLNITRTLALPGKCFFRNNSSVIRLLGPDDQEDRYPSVGTTKFGKNVSVSTFLLEKFGKEEKFNSPMELVYLDICCRLLSNEFSYSSLVLGKVVPSHKPYIYPFMPLSNPIGLDVGKIPRNLLFKLDLKRLSTKVVRVCLTIVPKFCPCWKRRHLSEQLLKKKKKFTGVYCSVHRGGLTRISLLIPIPIPITK
ncbi:hypothetical protein H8356DRAFT_1351511 [Neocallimastix lanati (nom. inval.)]|nr:hypothetical protein H8356DRAFT_1351511 [Neocallimastix sp. JGI-2020a]